MAEVRRSIISVEMLDGTTYLDHRVLFTDKIRLERAARANKWDLARDEFTPQAFLAWAALEREGKIESTFEAFIEELADLTFIPDAGDTEDAGAGER